MVNTVSADGSKQPGDGTSAWPVKTKVRAYHIYCIGNISVNIAVTFLHVLSKLVTAFGVACDNKKWVKQVNFDGNRIALVITFIQIGRQHTCEHTNTHGSKSNGHYILTDRTFHLPCEKNVAFWGHGIWIVKVNGNFDIWQCDTWTTPGKMQKTA